MSEVEEIKPEERHIDLIGIGNPIVDLLAHVPEEFVEAIEGEKGGMELVDTDTLVELISSLPVEPSLAPGGSAGNTTYAAARLGTTASYLGKVGNCEMAEFYIGRYADIGADVSRFEQGAIPNARCLSLVTPDSQRTMRTDLGAAMTFAPHEVSKEDFAGVRHAHIEGYLAFNRELKQQVLDSAHAAGVTTSLDLASFEVVQACEDIMEKWLHESIDVVFANEDEAAAFFPDLPSNDYMEMARRLANLCGVAAVKLGPDGSIVCKRGGKPIFVEPVAVKEGRVVDTTGAGDYWAGGFLHAWLQEKELWECGRYGSVMGAEVVQTLGAMLPEERWKAVDEMFRGSHS